MRDLAGAEGRPTDARREVRAPWPSGRRPRLRARQIGCRFADREVTRTGAAGVVVVVAGDLGALGFPPARLTTPVARALNGRAP